MIHDKDILCTTMKISVSSELWRSLEYFSYFWYALAVVKVEKYEKVNKMIH